MPSLDRPSPAADPAGERIASQCWPSSWRGWPAGSRWRWPRWW